MSGLSRESKFEFFLDARGVVETRAPTRGEGRPCEDEGLGDPYLATRGDAAGLGEFFVRKLIARTVFGLKNEQGFVSFEFGPMSRVTIGKSRVRKRFNYVNHWIWLFTFILVKLNEIMTLVF